MPLPIAGAAGMAIVAYIGMSIAEFAKRAAVAVGFGITTYFGAYYILGKLENVIRDSLNGLPSDILSLLGIMKLDVSTTIILSAVLAKFTLQGWNKLTDSRVGGIMRKPGSSDSSS